MTVNNSPRASCQKGDRWKVGVTWIINLTGNGDLHIYKNLDALKKFVTWNYCLPIIHKIPFKSCWYPALFTWQHPFTHQRLSDPMSYNIWEITRVKLWLIENCQSLAIPPTRCDYLLKKKILQNIGLYWFSEMPFLPIVNLSREFFFF